MIASDVQLDLFSAAGAKRGVAEPPAATAPPVAVDALDDTTLVTAIPEAGLADASRLTAEAARRHLTAAVPALERLCQRFAGFGLAQPVPEQVAALDALAEIGGPESVEAVVRIIIKGLVQGPTVGAAIAAAARLGASLPADTVLPLLRHSDPRVRADACRCARFRPDIAAVLSDLLQDLHQEVADQAACALGRMGQTEARPTLQRLLRDAPTAEAIDAIADIADEETVVLLGRIARSGADLAEAARNALAIIDHPLATHLRDALDKAQPADTA
ncbi:MAG: HEAT repeat domain-containing protein [Magnetospirillum sp.]|nr:HEAT repeat domain-containing protein [Magnetospirillum sp.]